MDVQMKKIKDDARNQTNKVYSSLLKQVSVSLSRSSLTKQKIMESQTNLLSKLIFHWPGLAAWGVSFCTGFGSFCETDKYRYSSWASWQSTRQRLRLADVPVARWNTCSASWVTHNCKNQTPKLFLLPNNFLCEQEQPIFKFWWLQHGAWGKFLPSSLTATRPSLCSRYVAVVFWLTLIVYCILI